MQEPDLPYMTRSPHALFLKTMQEWIWRRYPSRQMSATDIFYAMQWAESEIPVSMLIEGFESFLKEKPDFFEDGCKLSKLNFLATKIIYGFRSTSSAIPQPIEKIVVDDPYETALHRLTSCGRQTDNPILKEMLRKFYRFLKKSCDEARSNEPDWNQRMDAFYRLKAQALLVWDQGTSNLCNDCLALLSEQEQASLLSLTPAEQMHCLLLGEDAEARYRTQVLHQKIASYFGFSELLESL